MENLSEGVILGSFYVADKWPLTQFCLQPQGHCDINLRNNKRQTALALAVSEAYTAMIELLVEHGADVNADDEDGDTPLHLAVIHQAVGTTGFRRVSVLVCFT